jgi:glycosyltransferase involved in cell wall biosynthesis
MQATSDREPHIGIVANSIFAVYNFRLGLIRHLRAQGYRVTVMAPMDGFAHLLLREGIHIVPLPHRVYSLNPLRELVDTYILWQRYGRLRFDLLFHYTIKPNTFGSLAAWLRRIPSIAVVTGTGNLFFEQNRLLRFLMHSLYRFTSPLARELWFLNEEDRRAFLHRSMVAAARTRMIPGEGVDTTYYLPQPPVADRREKVFLFIGRLIREKGIREYVQAARRLHLHHPDARFRILGYLEDAHPSAIPASEIEEWVREGLIEYLGGTTDIRPFVADADVVVLPSYGEGMNRTLQEAASMARPLIASDRPGCRELILPGRSGVLVAPGDVDALCQAMEELLHLSDQDREIMGQVGRRHIVAHFRQEKVFAVYDHVIHQYLPTHRLKRERIGFRV